MSHELAIPEPQKYPRLGPNRVPYSEAIKEFAFEIWAFEAGQSASQTVKLLKWKLGSDAKLVDYYLLNSFDEVTIDNINSWKNAGEGWTRRLYERMTDLMPELQFNTLRDMGLALLDSVRISNEIMHGHFVDAKAAAVQLKAVHGLWDRTGFAPRTDVRTPVMRQEITPADLATKSIEELIEMDDMIREREALSAIE